MSIPSSFSKLAPKPRILLLGSQMAVAGAQRVLLDQADWLSARGYQVTVAFLYDRDGLQSAWQAGRSYPLLDLRFRKQGAGFFRNALSFAGGLLRLFQLLRSGRFQVIETFTHHSNLIGCPLAWLAGVPVRIASHHGRIERLPRLLERLHAWMVNRGIATRLVAVSREVVQQSIEEGVQPQRISLIPNGVAPQAHNPQLANACRLSLLDQPNGQLLISVGRLTYQKGHTFLLQAMPAVLERFPNTHLALAGDGPLRADLEAEAARLGIQDRVHFLGVRGDVPELLAAADVFVMPSRWEGLPLALLEAMNAGKPVVVSEVPGVREALDGGACGIIVPIENPQALAGALTELIADGSLRMRLGQAAQTRFNCHYTLDTMMARYLDLLDPDQSPLR